jgi:hypothetical protein
MMSVPSAWGQFCILAGMKTRLAVNTAMKGRGRWSLFLMLMFPLVWFALMWSGASDLVKMLTSLASPTQISFLLGLVLVYCLGILTISDLFMGHTLNVGQVSTDYRFLTCLPVKATTILAAKLFERMFSNWLGIFFLLGSFLGIALRDGFQLVPCGLALLLYIQLELGLGLATTVFSIGLHRFLRPAAVANVFSLMAYLSAFLSFLPIVWFSSHPQQMFLLVLGFQSSLRSILEWGTLPAAWIAEILTVGTVTPALLKWFGFWAVWIFVGRFLYSAMVSANWLGFVHPGIKAQAVESTSWFSGLYRKELLLLKSDFNLLSNALFLPFTLIVLEVWLLRETFSLTSVRGVMNGLGAAALYFCMFGPMNSVGSEGRAIAMLESLPIRPATLLKTKIGFWYTIAILFFGAAGGGTMVYLGFSSEQIFPILGWLAVLLLGFTIVAVSLSGIFPDFEAKVLQKSSSMEGKFLAGIAMGSILPVKTLNPDSLSSWGIFAAIAALLFQKAGICLKHRQDTEFFRRERVDFADFLLVILAMLSIQSLLGQTLASLEVRAAAWVPGLILGVLVAGYATYTIVVPRFGSLSAGLGNGPWNWQDGGLVLVGALATAWGYASFRESMAGLEAVDFFFGSGFGAMDPGFSWGKPVVFALLGLVFPALDELWMRGLARRAFFDLWGKPVVALILPVLLPCLLLPWSCGWLFSLLSCGGALVYWFRGNISLCVMYRWGFQFALLFL